jgi:hypothetical protein
MRLSKFEDEKALLLTDTTVETTGATDLEALKLKI